MIQIEFARAAKRLVARVQLSHIIVVALVIGLFGGSLARARLDQASITSARQAFDVVGTLWMNALRMTVIPLIVPLLIGALTRETGDQMKRIGVITVMTIAGMLSLFAASAALCSPFLFPADAFDPAHFAAFRHGVTLPESDASFAHWLLQLIPPNPIKAAADGAILPVVIFAVSFGFAARGASPTQRLLISETSSSLSAVMLRVVDGVLLMSPIGVLAIGLNMGIELGAHAINTFAHYLLAIVLCTMAAITLVGVLAWMLGGVTPRQFWEGAGSAMLVGLSTSSSLAALPVMVEGARLHWTTPEEVADFVLPTSVSVFKATAAFSWVVKAFFVSQLYGAPLDAGQLAAAAGLAVLGNATIPGIPGGSIIAMGPLFLALGLPLEGLALLLAIDPVTDRLLTMGNVAADMCVATIVARWSQGGRRVRG